mgnify:FL=1
MLRQTALCLVFITTATLFTGCIGGGSDETAVKSMDEYRQEAASSINAGNAEAELDKLMKEIDADAP